MGKKKRGALTGTSQREREELLFAELDAHQDEKAYRLVERGDPISADILTRMVDAGIPSEKIVAHMLYKYPHLWPQTQALLAGPPATWRRCGMSSSFFSTVHSLHPYRDTPND